jgi:hypothetical protein
MAASQYYAGKGPELLERLSEELRTFEPWQFKIANVLGQLVFKKAPELRKDHQKYIHNSRYREIVQEAPFFWQIINKPEGYAGDAEMMNLIYRNDFEGDTPFGIFLHKAAVSLPACQSVRNRRTFLRDEILKSKNHGGERRILSVAAGPAMEIRDVLMQNRPYDTVRHTGNVQTPDCTMSLAMLFISSKGPTGWPLLGRPCLISANPDKISGVGGRSLPL